LELLAVT